MRLLFILFVFICFTGYSEETIDSLENVLPKLKGKEKAEALNQISYLSSETSFEKAYLYSKKALEFSNEINYPEGIIKSYLNMGVAYYFQSNYKKAEENFQTALKLSKDNKIKYLEARSLNGLGVVCKSWGQFDRALGFYQESLKIEQESGKEIGVATIHGNIGNIYTIRKMYDKAKEHHYAALEIQKKLKDDEDIAQSLSNIGLVLMEENKYEEALVFFSQSLDIFSKKNNNGGVSRCFHNIGETYMFMEKYELAYENINKSFKSDVESGNQVGAVISLSTLANLFTLQGKYDQAISYLKNAIEMADKIDALYEKEQCYKDLYKTYLKTGDFKNALDAYKMSTEISDTIFNNESEQRMLELQTIYETEQKDKEIALRNVEIDNKNKDIDREKSEKQIIYIILAIIVGFSLVLFIQIRAKVKANRLLKLKNEEVSQQKEEIETQRDEIETQNDLLHDQKSKIEIINKEITDSIHYAKRIQNAVLPSVTELNKSFSENFVFYLPKDIVSGDFYWVREIDDKIVFAVADCTGHGVPGGFMSMLGISLLNEIVDRNRITSPAEILNQLRKQIIASVGHSNQKTQLGDGMDICLCSINKKNMEVEFSGANNSMYMVISENNLNNALNEFQSGFPEGFSEKVSVVSDHDHHLIEIKGDKMPVGIHVNQNIDFRNVKFNLKSGDTVYLTTDGFIDQFGGTDGRKYMQKRFKDFLISISTLKMEKQRPAVETEFHSWKNPKDKSKTSYEQTDDVLVVGFRLT